MTKLVVSTPIKSLRQHALAYWLPAAGSVAAAVLLDGGTAWVIFAALFAVSLLTVGFIEASRGVYQVTIDRNIQLVVAEQSLPLKKELNTRKFDLSSFASVASKWDENYYSYCVELVAKDGRGALLLKRFKGKRSTTHDDDTSAAFRSQIAAFTGLADAGLAPGHRPTD